MNQMREAETDV